MWGLWLLLLLAGCASASDAAPAASVWGQVVRLGEAEQTRAPALIALPDGLTAVWVGADAAGVHHDARRFGPSGWSSPVVLPLPPVRPYGQQLAPAGGGAQHLLWLDASPEGQNTLYNALLAPDLTVMRGPTPVLDKRILRYTTLPAGGGALWVIASGGLPAEPALYLTFIDAEGRPRADQPAPLMADADWPAVVQGADGSSRLFWRRETDGSVMHANLTGGALEAAQPAASLPLNPGDRLESLSASLDQTHAYVFWNLTRAGGEREAGYAAGAPGTAWSPGRRLAVSWFADQTVETGFNTGPAQAAQPGDIPLAWAAPLAGQFDRLPVAVQENGGLGILYMQGGEPVAYQRIVEQADLVGLPALITDHRRFLYLAWTQTIEGDTARLLLTSLRFALEPAQP